MYRVLQMQAATERHLRTVLERTRLMATQDDVNALAAQVDALTAGSTAVTDALVNIQGDIDTLLAATPGLDLSVLQASVTAATTAQATAVSKAQAIAAER
jgi:hypothetical protein